MNPRSQTPRGQTVPLSWKIREDYKEEDTEKLDPERCKEPNKKKSTKGHCKKSWSNKLTRTRSREHRSRSIRQGCTRDLLGEDT